MRLRKSGRNWVAAPFCNKIWFHQRITRGC
ncbi:KxYKxGKxW signal peptide domain-containing protein [Escherichia coli]